tara:strand:+ start:115 stop:612 length:498 start_codon:yes stop_codon:yes gene_type:complete
MSFSAAAVLAGCATTAIVPTEGDWSYQALEYTEDTCGAAGLTGTSIATLEALVVTVTLTDEGFEAVIPGFDPVAMTQDGDDFSGVAGLDWEITEWEDADGNTVESTLDMSMDMNMSGTFLDENTGSFEAVLDGTCSGDDCEAYMAVNGVEENPCTATLVGEFVAQ